MKSKRTFLITLPLLLASSLVFKGCCGPSMGVLAGDTASYSPVQGELVVLADASLDRAFAAGLTAMQELNFEVTSQDKDGFEANIHAKRFNNQTITIKFRTESATKTEVRIHAGVLGDRKESEKIYEIIRKHY
ncbi:MAG: hypothetical protein K0S07_950 [Chlamydiales bacterium]|jgi:hypothetical protein|nr:hypothetical protein [Chlamydiales bacterium]